MRPFLYALAVAAAAAAVTLTPDTAEACGGLFCDGGGPTQVNQSAERIIFASNPDGTVTAVVQILYDGPTDRFGWLLPVPGIPDVGLSSDAAFLALQQATNPQYQLSTRVEGDCKEEDFDNNDFSENDGSINNGTSAGANNGTNNGVTVLARGNTGPYDYVVIQIDSEMNKLQTALDWLADNNYQTTDAGPGLIGPYLDEGYNLLAVRLQKTSDTGSVRPIRLTYDTDHPMIPIKLTAVAANEDMGVMTWVLGPSRAVPVNYKALELNDALINWFTGASNYNDVIIAAANEASGQGFVTEYADTTDTLSQIIWTANHQAVWNDIQITDWTGRHAQLLEATILQLSVFDQNTFANVTIDGLDQVIEIAMPSLTSDERQLLTECPSCFVNNGMVPANFSYVEWVSAVGEYMVDPMKETQELFDDLPYVTRMYTTMSAEEMTIDPSFDYNPDLAKVSNIHNATQIIECNPTVYRWEAPFRVELPSGLVVRGSEQGVWPVQANEMMPATLTVSEVGTSGDGMVVRDNRDAVESEISAINALTPPYEPGPYNPDEDGDGDFFDGDDDEPSNKKAGDGDVSGGSCSVAGGASGLGSVLLGFVLVAFRRRRRV